MYIFSCRYAHQKWEKGIKTHLHKKPVDWKQTRKLLQSSWEILKLGGQANKLLISSHYVQPKLDNLLHFLIECKFCFFLADLWLFLCVLFCTCKAQGFIEEKILFIYPSYPNARISASFLNITRELHVNKLFRFSELYDNSKT